MRILILSSIFFSIGSLASAAGPDISSWSKGDGQAAPTTAPVESEKKSAPTGNKLDLSAIKNDCLYGKEVTDSIPEKVRTYCAASKFTRYFWQQTKKELGQSGKLTPAFSKALDGENPCVDYYEALVKAEADTDGHHRQQCEQLVNKAASLGADCERANSCANATKNYLSEAETIQKKFSTELVSLREKINEFQGGNQKYMTHLKKEVSAFTAMPAPQKLQKESDVSGPITLGTLRGVDGNGKAVMANKAAASAASETFRVDAARTQSATLEQHKQRLEEASKGAIQVQKDLEERKTSVEEKEKKTQDTVAKLEKNQQTLEAGGSGLGSAGSGLLAAASALGNAKQSSASAGAAPGTIAPMSSSISSQSTTSKNLIASVPPTARVQSSDSSPDTTGSSMKGTLAALDAATGEQKKKNVKDYSLKDKLTASLRESTSSSSGSPSSSSVKTGEGERAQSATADLLKANGSEANAYSSGGSGPGFAGEDSAASHAMSLATSDSAAKVQQMIGELEGSGAVVQSAALLQAASTEISLFIRISGTYQKLAKRLAR